MERQGKTYRSDVVVSKVILDSTLLILRRTKQRRKATTGSKHVIRSRSLWERDISRLLGVGVEDGSVVLKCCGADGCHVGAVAGEGNSELVQLLVGRVLHVSERGVLSRAKRRCTVDTDARVA